MNVLSETGDHGVPPVKALPLRTSARSMVWSAEWRAGYSTGPTAASHQTIAPLRLPGVR